MLSFINSRFASKREIFLLFAACVFPTHFWAYVVFFHELPSYLLRLDLVGIVGVFSYAMAYALLESLLVLGFLTFVAAILPRKLFLNHFAAQGTVIVFLSAIWVIPVQFQEQILSTLSVGLREYLFLAWLWIMLYVGIIGALPILLRRKRVEETVLVFVERLMVLSMIYLVIDVFALFVILVRNLT